MRHLVLLLVAVAGAAATAAFAVGGKTTTTPIDSWVQGAFSNGRATEQFTKPDGTPDVGVSVTLTSRSVPAPVGVYTGVTDSTGTATFTLPAGHYDVTSSAGTGTGTLIIGPAGGVLSDCGWSAPPAPDPCSAVQGTIRYGFLVNLVNAQTFKNWAKANPGELARFTAYLASPSTSEPVMLTALGVALVQVVQAYAYAKGGPAQLPAANPVLPPCPKGMKCDRTPPSEPGNLTVK